MSKKLAKTVLSTAVAGVLFGVSFATLAETETEVDSYSVIKLDGADRSKLDREKFQIEVYKKDGKDKDGKDYGSILYGIRPDVMAKKGQELYKFDNQGYVYFEDNKGVERKIYDEGVGEFVRSLKKTDGPVHGMDEGEIRGLTLRIENAKQLLSEGAELKSTTAELKSTTAELKSTTTELQSALKSDTTKNSVALGANSVITRDNEVYIGYKTESEYGTRVLGGLSDGTRNSDAATVGQLNRKVGGVYDDVKARITVESEKQKKYTDQKTSEVNEKVESRTLVGVSSDGTLTRAEGAKNTISVNDGLVALSGRTDRIDAAVGAIDGRVTRNTQSIEKNSKAIAANTRTLQQHSARLDSQQRQINENHKEMKRAAAQSAALTGLFQPYSVGKFNATAAVGGYSDEQALAVGVGYRFNEQTAAKAGVAFSDGDASWNVGVNFEF
ncbi:YadA C-terminal domain-containing protein [Escherichia coli]|uniref:YadA-like family protein n=6 Tax=Escherichia coli TaxID=562 RepID=A0AB73V209_ECOLX|nr:YadA C-terminal domain-containing protein [Escherichia coli]QLG57351.1 YadA-like family protein [Escherichia coli]